MQTCIRPQACGYDAANCMSFAVMETGSLRQKNEYHADLQLILRHVVTMTLIVCPSPSWKRQSKEVDSTRCEEHERSTLSSTGVSPFLVNYVAILQTQLTRIGTLRSLDNQADIQYRCRFQVAH